MRPYRPSGSSSISRCANSWPRESAVICVISSAVAESGPITATRRCGSESKPVVVVDTSVWIDFIAGRGVAAVARLRELLDRGGAVVITPQIFQEILQGADSERKFREFASYLG